MSKCQHIISECFERLHSSKGFRDKPNLNSKKESNGGRESEGEKNEHQKVNRFEKIGLLKIRAYDRYQRSNADANLVFNGTNCTTKANRINGSGCSSVHRPDDPYFQNAQDFKEFVLSFL